MVHTVELDETKHAVTLLHGYKQLRHDEDLYDFTIQVESHEYRVHKAVLAVRSPYFKAMLKHDVKESQEAKVQMKEVDAECVKSCIDFMYSGKFDIPDGKADKLLHVATMMQLEDVKRAICDILDEELNAKNFYQTQSIAEMYQLSLIMKKCRKYYEENFMAISTQPGFQYEKKSHLVNILKSKRLRLREDDKLAVSLSWAGNNPEKTPDLFELVKCVKLREVSFTYLSDLIENHPIISSDFRLYRLMNEPLVNYVKTGGIAPKNSCSEDLLVLFDRDADCLRSYDPTTHDVQKFHEAKFKHLQGFVAVSMDSFIYVLCRNKSVHRLKFKDKNSNWERMQDMIANHGWYPPSVSFSGSLVVVGSHVAPRKDVEKFDPVANKWVRLADKPAPVEVPTLVSLDDSIYCIGGHNGFSDLNSLCRFTPSTSKWVDLQPMKYARSGCGAVAVDQRIFVMGGWHKCFNVKELECYDVTSGRWTSLSPMIDCHYWNIAHHINGWIFSLSRESSSNEIEKYDIANNRWIKLEFKGVSCCNIRDCVAVQS